MRIRQSFEQAICILLFLGVQDGVAIKNQQLSEVLGVSDSYLKKVTRQLVVAGLITSRASKLGGFVLNRSLDRISFFDIFEAIEGKEKFIETTHLVDKVFHSSPQVKETEDLIITHLEYAETQYKEQLKKITLDHIIQVAHKK